MNSVSPRHLPRFSGPWASDLEARIALATECLDSEDIPRVGNAGHLVNIDGDWFQVMHNGVLMLAGGYYGDWTVDLIARCKGVHEPQEERIFHEVLKGMGEGAVMLELGCYWAYYSIWFARTVARSRVILVEPIEHRRAVAERNLAVNCVEATFMAAAIGDVSRPNIHFQNGPATAADIEQLSVDDLMKQQQLPIVDLLHADIQGFEYAMLRGASHALAEHRIKYVFISTHRWLEEGRHLDLHQTCRDRLISDGYLILAEHTPEESYSVDGLLVAYAPEIAALAVPEISRKG